MIIIRQKKADIKSVKGIIRTCGFLSIFTYTGDWLFKVRLRYSRVKECPARLGRQGLEIPEKLL